MAVALPHVFPHPEIQARGAAPSGTRCSRGGGEVAGVEPQKGSLSISVEVALTTSTHFSLAKSSISGVGNKDHITRRDGEELGQKYILPLGKNMIVILLKSHYYESQRTF